MSDIINWLIQALFPFYKFQSHKRVSVPHIFSSDLPRSHPTISLLQQSLGESGVSGSRLLVFLTVVQRRQLKERLLCLRVVLESVWHDPVSFSSPPHLLTQLLVSHPRPLRAKGEGKTLPEVSPLIHYHGTRYDSVAWVTCCL